MSKPLIIAVDFDGTIVAHRFPEIGPAMPGAIETLKALQAAGHKIVLNTCREDGGGRKRRYLTEAVDWLRERGIVPRSVNENHRDDDFREESLRRKVYANVYVDDLNLGGFPGWATVARKLRVRVPGLTHAPDSEPALS